MSSSSSSSDDSDASKYFPTPIRHTMAGQTPLASLPNKCCVTEIQQLGSFIRKTNRGCERKGYRGKIVPVEVVTKNLGGAVKIVYRCRKCSSYSLFGSRSNPTMGSLQQRNISMATQVAFISAGCTHATCKKVLRISAVSFEAFMSTIPVADPGFSKGGVHVFRKNRCGCEAPARFWPAHF